MDKQIYLCLAHMSKAGLEQKYVKEAFDTNWVVPLGPNVNAFEEDLKQFTGGTHEVVALSAGTAVSVREMKCWYRALLSVPLRILSLIWVPSLCLWVLSRKLGIWTLCCWRRR